MSAQELRGIVRTRTVETLLGTEWRPAEPLRIGGLIGNLFATIKRGDDPRLIMGEINGFLVTLDNIDSAMADMNERK